MSREAGPGSLAPLRFTLDDVFESTTVRPALAGAAFALGLVNLALIAYLDLLATKRETYIWLINGPGPFGSFGSGPFQLLLHLGFLLASVGFAVIGAALLRRRKALLLPGIAAAVVGVLAGPATLLGALG